MGQRERETGEKEKKLQTQKNSWNFILPCFNPVTTTDRAIVISVAMTTVRTIVISITMATVRTIVISVAMNCSYI